MKTVEILPKRKKRDLLSATGETLRGVRKERGLTLRQVAEGAHVSVSYLAEIERGEKDPSSRILESIAGGLDIEMSGLLIRIAEVLEPTTTSAASKSALVKSSGGGFLSRSTFLARPSLRDAYQVVEMLTG